MYKEKKLWFIILILAVAALLLYMFFNRNYLLGNKIEVKTLEHRVEEYIESIDSNLVISDIFIYSDSDYYFSVEESDTGRGAIELLVDPYTGRIRPETGPNMMWNTKYNIHGGGMMGGYSYTNSPSIGRTEALDIANDYVTQYININYSVPDEGHEFYGYFTFHIEEQGQTVGMLSVNSYSGEVWFHNWHGTLENLISSHED